MSFFATTVWDLPIEKYPFVFRRTDQLEAIRLALLERSPHIAAVEGNYGVGKTFFAKQYCEQYGNQYPGGIHYFSSPDQAQYFAEQNLEQMQSSQVTTLYVIDETTSLAYDEYRLNRFLSRFACYRDNPHIHLLFIGQTVPQPLIHDGFRLNLTAISSDELDLYQSSVAQKFGISPDIWPDIKEKSQGNLRELYNLCYLVRENHIIRPNAIIHQSGILDCNGFPLQQKKSLIEIDVGRINSRLISDLAKNPQLLYTLTFREFEYLIADLFEKEDYQVRVTPASRDGGVDIYAAKKNHVGSFLFLIECKKNSPNNHVGVNVIRNLYGVLQRERATYSMVATTSFFTKGAIEFQKTISNQMSLCDYNDLVAWLYNHKE